MSGNNKNNRTTYKQENLYGVGVPIFEGNKWDGHEDNATISGNEAERMVRVEGLNVDGKLTCYINDKDGVDGVEEERTNIGSLRFYPTGTNPSDFHISGQVNDEGENAGHGIEEVKNLHATVKNDYDGKTYNMGLANPEVVDFVQGYNSNVSNSTLETLAQLHDQVTKSDNN
jgi:hypothetical protein